eukprot:scaffold281107_cov16-Prasinocladus_malaysianus.AAC.1
MADRALTHCLFVCPDLPLLLLDFFFCPQTAVEVSINTFDNRIEIAMKDAASDDMIVVSLFRAQACKRRESLRLHFASSKCFFVPRLAMYYGCGELDP